MVAPLPDFLALNGTPDPRTPRPPEPESQLPKIPQSAGRVEPKSNIPPDPGKPLDMGFLDPVQVVPPGTPVSPHRKEATGARERKGINFPGQKYSGDEIQNAIRVLAESNIHSTVPLPEGITPTPLAEWDDDYESLDQIGKTFLRVLEKSGRVTKAAEIAGISRSGIRARKMKDPAFARLWDQALSHRAELIEDEAMRRAVNGIQEPVYYMGAVCGHKQVYSDSLLSKLLEGNMPEKYRVNHKVEIEGKLGVATLVLPAVTTADEWAAQNSGTIIDQEPEDEYAQT